MALWKYLTKWSLFFLNVERFIWGVFIWYSVFECWNKRPLLFDSLTCYSRKSTGVTNIIDDGSAPFKCLSSKTGGSDTCLSYTVLGLTHRTSWHELQGSLSRGLKFFREENIEIRARHASSLVSALALFLDTRRNADWNFQNVG